MSMPNTTWNPSDKSANITLSGGNLIATCSGGAAPWVRAVDKQIAGKFYWEITATTWASTASGVGICSPTCPISNSFGSNLAIGSCGINRAGNAYVDGVTVFASSTITSGSVICIAFNADTREIWFRVGAAGNWNNNAANNPATGVGGINTKLAIGIPALPAFYAGNTSEAVTANFGDAAFVGAVPSGFTSGFAAAIDTVLLVHADGTNGSTTFTDVSRYAHVLNTTLASVSTTSPKFGTGSGYFAGSSLSRVVSVGSQSEWNFGAGQFTIEAWAYFTVAPTGVQIVVGRNTGSSNLGWNFGMNAGTLYFSYSTTGTDGPNVGTSYSPTLNTWIHLAVDRDASNMLRVYVNGAVIASATVSALFFASTAGVTIGNDFNITRGFPGLLDEIRITRGTARYGGAFTPPTAPFELDELPTNALASQALAEHWLTTNPDARITQVVAEHWASVTSDNLQAVVTQVLIEHWASVASVSPASGGPQVTMIH